MLTGGINRQKRTLPVQQGTVHVVTGCLLWKWDSLLVALMSVVKKEWQKFNWIFFIQQVRGSIHFSLAMFRVQTDHKISRCGSTFQHKLRYESWVPWPVRTLIINLAWDNVDPSADNALSQLKSPQYHALTL